MAALGQRLWVGVVAPAWIRMERMRQRPDCRTPLGPFVGGWALIAGGLALIVVVPGAAAGAWGLCLMLLGGAAVLWPRWPHAF
jgi:hypothetical protein